MSRSPVLGSGTWTGPLILALVSITGLTLNLRSAMASVSPIIPWIREDLSISAVQLGILGMIPALAFAVAGTFSAALSYRLGMELCILLSILVMGIAHLLRSLSTSFEVFLVMTACILLASGIGGILIPPYIKETFGTRAVMVSSVYLCAISASTALPPIIAAPVAEVAGWRASLNVWTLLAALALIPWFISWLKTARGRGMNARITVVAPESVGSKGSVLRSRIFWGLALLHGMNTFFTFTVFAWLPTFLSERSGLSAEVAGLLLGLFAVLTVPMAMVVPRLMKNGNSDHRILHFFILFLVLGWIGLWAFPTVLPWLWVLFVSMGTGIFVVYQVLLIKRTVSSQVTAVVSGYSQTFGYLVGSLGPLSVGMLHRWTGSWDAALAMLVVVAVLAFIVGQMFKDHSSIDPPVDSTSVATT